MLLSWRPLEAIATRVEAIASRLEAITIRLEAGWRPLLCSIEVLETGTQHMWAKLSAFVNYVSQPFISMLTRQQQ